MEPINLEQKFSQFESYWEPKIIGELNGQFVKVAKLKGEFIWHHHDHEDELFRVHKGTLRIELRDRPIILKPGEFFIVPRGVEHKPLAEEVVNILMFEPDSTSNTGNIFSDQTIHKIERI